MSKNAREIKYYKRGSYVNLGIRLPNQLHTNKDAVVSMDFIFFVAKTKTLHTHTQITLRLKILNPLNQ